MEDPDHLVGERADIDAELGGARAFILSSTSVMLRT
jgi:hypothetical protein